MTLTQKQKDIIERLGYQSPESFLSYYPYRYDHLIEKDFQLWEEKDKVVFFGVLASDFKTFRFGKRQSVHNFSVLHEGHVIKCSLFNRPFIKKSDYDEGLVVVGVVGKNKSITVTSITNKPLDTVLGIKPVYGLKAGIKNFEIIRLIAKILKTTSIESIIPKVYQTSYRLLERENAVLQVHQPDNERLLKDALRTLKYEEFLKYHLNYGLNHEIIRKGMVNELQDINQYPLPFVLNEGQLEAIRSIRHDLESSSNMFRMLQGDVGSGKTIVAFLSGLSLESGQVALMVPTETLAIQHFNNFKKMFPHASIGLLTSESEFKEETLNELSSGSLKFVIGTHALIQKNVRFNNLRLAMIDEQHRFGVEQRQALYDKGNFVDVLMLSATPIPRTLASSLFFDMSVSTLDTHPKNRQGTATHLVEENSIRSILEPIKETLSNKGQVYVVCPAIDVSERGGVKNVEAIYEQMQGLFPLSTINMLHGAMPSDVKRDVMQRFEQGLIDILVCTTVIEVGVDVHNANLMIIYNAELFGLATLHQLRGRVGRGSVKGATYLLSSAMEDEITQQRLSAMLSTDSGFELAMLDLRLRGFGDLLGSRQSGMPQFILGDIINDEAILKTAKKDAQTILSDRKNQDYQKILSESVKRSIIM